MFITLFGALNHILFGSPKGKSEEITLFSPEERELYNSISRKLLHFYEKQIEHPQLAPKVSLGPRVCVLIFRQSKSWREVETKLNAIPPMNSEIVKWASKWRSRITQMRKYQNQILDSLTFLKENERSISREETQAIKRKNLELKRLIGACLTSAKEEMDSLPPDSEIARDYCYNQFIQFLKTNWLHLTVFYEWSGVSFDEEKIFVEAAHSIDGTIPQYEKLVNECTKAIFLIQELKREESPLENENIQQGKVIKFQELFLKEAHLAPDSSSVKNSALAIELTKECFFDISFAKIEEMERKTKKISPIALKLQQIVKLTLGQVNQDLSQKS